MLILKNGKQEPHCNNCGKNIQRSPSDTIFDKCFNRKKKSNGIESEIQSI